MIIDTDVMSRRDKKIGLLDHLGGGNLGDDATLEAVKQNIKSRWPDAEIFGFSMNPEDTQSRHGIPAYPIRRKTWTVGYQIVAARRSSFKENVKTLLRKWHYLFRGFKAIHTVVVRMPIIFLEELVFLVRSLGHLRSLDVLIISGGGQLTDWFGLWQFPYAIFTWIVLARLANVKCIFLNVGAGPLTHPLSKFFIRRALLCSDYVSFRDERSRALAQSIGFKRSAHVFPDCVYALESPSLGTRATGNPSKPVVGIAPMPYWDPRSFYPEKNQFMYDSFIRTLSAFGSWLIRDNYGLTLLCTDIGIDPPTVEDLRSSLSNQELVCDEKSIVAASIKTTTDLLAHMPSLDYFVTCRFHGIVFAHLLNIPVIAISHHPKMDTLMGELGLAEYCIDIRTADYSVLKKAFVSLVANREEIKSRMAERLSLYREKLLAQFDMLIGSRAQSLPSKPEIGQVLTTAPK